MKIHLTALCMLGMQYSIAQLSDDFSDGDFTQNPAWEGLESDFDASGYRLQLDASSAGEAYLSTALSIYGESSWEFLVHFDFNPSSTSYTKVFLMANASDLTADLDGYFVMIGDTEDEVSLYKKTGSAESYVINGTDDVIDSGTVHVRIRVTRDEQGNWALYHDTTGGTDYTQEGLSTKENTFATASHFGVYCKYTSSRINAIYFDDFVVNTSTAKFAVSSVVPVDNRSLRVQYNQPVDLTTATTLSNYFLSHGYGYPIAAERDVTNLNAIVLTFSDDFANNTYLLDIDQVTNEVLDETVSNSQFSAIVQTRTPFRYLVINEILADPTPVMGLPDAEYIELYNPSSYAINLENFTIDGRTLPDFELDAKSYVVLTAEANSGLFSGTVISLSGLSLTNGGELLMLVDNLGNLVDSVTYSSEWYIDTSQRDGGYSLAQFNPTLECSSATNWAPSSNANGGTPGFENDSYNIDPDLTGPNLVGLHATSDHSIHLTFDESMLQTSLENAGYSLDNGIALNGNLQYGPGYQSIELEVMPEFIDGTTYTITIDGAADCAGNDLVINTLTFDYDTSPPSIDRIIIKDVNRVQVLFDEALDAKTAEIESNYSLLDGKLNPTSVDVDEENPTTINVLFDEDFGYGVVQALTIVKLKDLAGNVLTTPLAASFTYTQQVDSVSAIGVNLLDIYFTEALQITDATTVTNYWVDSTVGQPSAAFLDPFNQHMVHLVFQNNFDNNKELTLSISNLRNAAAEYMSTPDVDFIYDTAAPKVDTIVVASSRKMRLHFNEKIDPQSAESREHYIYENTNPTTALLNEDQQSVVLHFASGFEPEVISELSVDELKDLYGNEMKSKKKYEFVYDQYGPQLDSVLVRSPDELIVWFNEAVDKTTAEEITNYSINEGLIGLISATRDEELQHIVYLHLADSLPEKSGIQLMIAELQDQRGNATAAPLSGTFDYDRTYLSIIHPISQYAIQIEYNKVPDVSTARRPANYLLNGSRASSVQFIDKRIAVVTFDQALENHSQNTLDLNPIIDAQAIALYPTSYEFNFDARITSAHFISSHTVELVFDVKLATDQTPNLESFEALPALGNCIAAVVDKENNHVIRLTYDSPAAPNQEYTISWAGLTSEFGKWLPDYYATVIDDKSAPSITVIEIVNAYSIGLKFSETLDASSAEFIWNYNIDQEFSHPSDIHYHENDSSLLLMFVNPFIDKYEYTLTISNVEDLSGNALIDHEIRFIYHAPLVPSYGDLIITEIMADPLPIVGLSGQEYLELYNASDTTFSLQGLILTDESGSTTLLEGKIESQNYALLTSTSGVSDFEEVNVVGVTNFPSLNNSGETISIYSNSDLIFSTTYSTDWYGNSDKASGGWSLEMIDISNPCGEINNWKASENELGGTPGQVNSVQEDIPDNFGPEVSDAIAVSADSIVLSFNEKIHPIQFAYSKASIDPSIAIANSVLLEPENTKMGISLITSLLTEQVYEIEVNSVTDCKGNLIQPSKKSTIFRLPEGAMAKDILINEILFNPRTGGVDFVELYNHSDKAIDLMNWKLGTIVGEVDLITDDHLIMNPADYLVFTTNPDLLAIDYPKGNASTYIMVKNMANFSDSQDSVLLLNANAMRIDHMYYEDDFHFTLLDDTEGVSLERISFEAESLEPDTWKSAASTAGFATPGRSNSQWSNTSNSSNQITIEPKVFLPNNSGQNDYVTISYGFDHAGKFANVHVYAVDGYPVKSLAEGALLSTSGFLTWDGTTDDGRVAKAGYYIIGFELFDGSGHTSFQKATVVLGTDF